MAHHEEMTIDDALNEILGADLASSIIGEMGIHWALVAAWAFVIDYGCSPAAKRALERQKNASSNDLAKPPGAAVCDRSA